MQPDAVLFVIQCTQAMLDTYLQSKCLQQVLALVVRTIIIVRLEGLAQLHDRHKHT